MVVACLKGEHGARPRVWDMSRVEEVIVVVAVVVDGGREVRCATGCG